MSLLICLNARSTLFNKLFESIHTIILTLGIKDAHTLPVYNGLMIIKLDYKTNARIFTAKKKK